LNRLLEKQLKLFLGESYTTEKLFQSDKFRELLLAIDDTYDHNLMEKLLLERTINLNSRELDEANSLLTKQTKEISQLATIDALTGLANRHLYNDKIVQAVNNSKQNDNKFVIMFIDLDSFKTVNNSLGHHIGDLLLRHVAERLLSCVRKSDTVARMGGDEFTILLEEIQDVDDTSKISKNILDELSRPFHLDGQEIMLTASIGISVFPFIPSIHEC
jgi:diguanylate cyclase (GGDEF)-like protein